jgi:hypothetical protein
MGLGKISLEVCRYLNEMEHVMVKNVQDFFELATVIGRNRSTVEFTLTSNFFHFLSKINVRNLSLSKVYLLVTPQYLELQQNIFRRTVVSTSKLRTLILILKVPVLLQQFFLLARPPGISRDCVYKQRPDPVKPAREVHVAHSST